MPTFNSDAFVATLAEAEAADPNVKGQMWAKVLHIGSKQFDHFSAFEAPEVKSGMYNSKTPKGIFCVKNDLNKGGGAKVHVTVMSDLAGPGVMGEAELTGNTSKPQFRTYPCIIDYHRDAVEFTEKMIDQMAAGRDIWPAAVGLLKVKLGRKRQHDMMMALIRNGSGNTMRPNGRMSRDSLLATDTIDPSFAVNAKVRATRMGAQAIRKSVNAYGTNVYGYLFFGTETSMLDVRNDTGYQNAIQQAGVRGDENPMFTGRLVQWQNVYWFEHQVVDPDWDDYLGSPLEPRAILGTGFDIDTAAANCELITNSANTKNQYYQFFPGFDYQWYEDQVAAPDTAKYYAWIINPDNSVGFVRYTGSSNNGNKITLDQILDPTAAGGGTSTLGSAVVGNIDATGDGWGDGTDAAGGTGPGTDADFTYTSTFLADAIILPANANGVVIGHSFMFGANAAVRCYGRTKMKAIEQERDYDFVKGRGFQTIFGQAPTARTDGKTNNYVLCEHAINPEGILVPALDA